MHSTCFFVFVCRTDRNDRMQPRNRDSRERNFNNRDNRDPRDNRDNRDNRENRDNRDSRGPIQRDEREKPKRTVNPEEIENRMPKLKPDVKPVRSITPINFNCSMWQYHFDKNHQSNDTIFFLIISFRHAHTQKLQMSNAYEIFNDETSE